MCTPMRRFPQVLLEALTRRAGQLRNVEMMHLLGFGEAYYNRPEFAESFRHNALFIGSNMRQTVEDGRADYIPVHLSEIEDLFLDKRVELDVALLQVSTPDRHGYCSLGVAVETTLTAARCARIRIAQVNDQMPRTFGNTFMHVNEFDAIVECSHPLPELRQGEVTEEHRLIARNVAGLIEDGACVQVGIGLIPSAILPYLSEHKDLGIHTRDADGKRNSVDRKGRDHRGQEADQSEQDCSWVSRWAHANGTSSWTTIRCLNFNRTAIPTIPSSSRRTITWLRSIRRLRSISPGRRCRTRWEEGLSVDLAGNWILCAARRAAVEASR